MYNFQAFRDWLAGELLSWKAATKKNKVLRIKFPEDSYKRVEAVIDISACEDVGALMTESLRVSTAIYEYGKKGVEIRCCIVDGKIKMFTTTGDPGGGEAVLGDEDGAVVQLFPKAA